jgi:transposase InsO family protein
MYHLADAFESLGRHHDHRVMREKTVRVFRRVLPENHPLTATACLKIGASYAVSADAGDLQRAMEYAREALRMFQATSHPDVEGADSAYNLVSHISNLLLRATK